MGEDPKTQRNLVTPQKSFSLSVAEDGTTNQLSRLRGHPAASTTLAEVLELSQTLGAVALGS